MGKIKGNLKGKFKGFINNPDVALKEQMGYVSGVLRNLRFK